MLSDKLKELRTSKGYTQSDTAKLVNISAPAYSAYESGKSIPPLDTLIYYAKHYNVSLDWLCDVSPNKPALENYGDIATLIHNLLSTGFFELSPHDVSTNYGVYNHAKITTFKGTPYDINRFLLDYYNMKDLLKRNSITNEIFNTWLSSSIDNLSKKQIQEKR